MSEQPDLFPEDAAKADQLKETDILHNRKRRHKSTQALRDLRRLVRVLKDKSNAVPEDPDSVIEQPRYK